MAGDSRERGAGWGAHGWAGGVRPDDVAVEHIEHARRRTGIDKDLRQRVNDARALRRRFEDKGIPGGD